MTNLFEKRPHHWLQVVNDHHSGWGDQQLVDDLLAFFCTKGTTKRLCKQLADRIGNTQSASKQTKMAAKKAFTGSEAVRLIFSTLGCRSEVLWHNAHMPISGSTWFNGAVEPLSQMNDCDCAS